MKSKQISEYLQSRIEANDFPSVSYLVAEKGEIVLQDAIGLAVVEPERIEAKIDTIYDLASMTKVLVTGLLCAKLIESGEIKLSDKIAKYFGEFDSDDKREITIENLLTHTSGFRAWLPFYSNHIYSADPIDTISRIELLNPINSKVVYSDLNFILLGHIIKKKYNNFFNYIARDEIFIPLGLQKTFFNPHKSYLRKIAASEKGNEFEKKTCKEQSYVISQCPLRDYQIWGEVHDGNCYHMKGISGHAGLFSTAEEVFKIAQQFLPNQTTLLKPETCELFQTNFTPNLNEARSIAFQLAETKDSSAGSALSKNSFGHLGFTGTSLWIEPETERIFILLTNRTHAHELPFVILNSVRRKFHELACSELRLEA